MRREPVAVWCDPAELAPGDRFYWHGMVVEVHRTAERPGAGTAVVVQHPSFTDPNHQRRWFYRTGEKVEVIR